jgi:hypothetical protein
MIGCTLITPAYAEIGMEAVKRFKRHTGLDVVILWRDDGPDAFAAKLDIPLTIKNQTVVFFDSDLWFIRDVDISWMDRRDQFLAVLDPGVNDVADPSINVIGSWARSDCEVLGIEPTKYFNGGFWVANFQRHDHQQAFARARQLYQDKLNGVFNYDKVISKPKDVMTFLKTSCRIGDYGEQSFLNAGVQREGIEILELPMQFNYWHMAYKGGLVASVPYGINAVHAAGYAIKDKMDHLRQMSDVLDVWFKKPRDKAFTL